MGLYDKKLRNQKREWNKAARAAKKGLFPMFKMPKLKTPKLKTPKTPATKPPKLTTPTLIPPITTQSPQQPQLLIGITDAVCPYCDHRLKKMPARKTECPACGKDIFVQTRPEDKVRVLLRADELLAREVDELSRSISEYRQAQMQTAIEFGTSILGSLFGKKLTSAADVSRAATAICAVGAGRDEDVSDELKSLQEQLARKQEALAMARSKRRVPQAAGPVDTIEAADIPGEQPCQPSSAKKVQEDPSVGVSQVTTSGKLRFHCPNCAKAINAPPESVGRKGKCPGCARSVTVPAPQCAKC